MSEKVISSEKVYSGKAIKVARKQVRLPSGRTTVREIIEHPGSVSIVPVVEGKILLLNQLRLAAGGAIWEIPAGTMEEGEEAQSCAKRELEEETGFRAGVMEYLFESYLSPGYSEELMRFFLAKDLVATQGHQQEDEILLMKYVTPNEALEMISSYEIKDAKTVAAISYLMASGRLQRT